MIDQAIPIFCQETEMMVFTPLGILCIGLGARIFFMAIRPNTDDHSLVGLIFMIEMSAIFTLTGFILSLGILYPSSAKPISYLLLFVLSSIPVITIIWLIYKLLKYDAAYGKKHPHHEYPDIPEGKHKNDEKPKRQSAYWETWPKKKKRGLPPEDDQGGVG